MNVNQVYAAGLLVAREAESVVVQFDHAEAEALTQVVLTNEQAAELARALREIGIAE